MKKFIAGFIVCYLLTGIMIGTSLWMRSNAPTTHVGALKASIIYVIAYPYFIIDAALDGLERRN